MVYQALLSLLESEIETQDCTGIEFLKGEFGVIGVKSLDDLGCSRRIVIGKQSTRTFSRDYRYDSSITAKDDRSFQGKMQSDLLSIGLFTCSKVTPEYELGYINVNKQQVKKASKPLLTLLLDFAYQSTCVRASDEVLERHPGQRLHYRVNEMSFAMMGLSNIGPNRLIKYESSPCFPDWRLHFVKTGHIYICQCDADAGCEVQRIALAMYGIALDVVKILRSEFKAKITLESMFSRSFVLDFIMRFTTRVALDKFLIKCHVPRSYVFDNTKSNFTIDLFKHHILSKDEALEPKKFNPSNSDRADPFVGRSQTDNQQ